MRGLKLLNRRNIHKYKVASFTDAWIETEDLSRAKLAEERRIFYRCVD